MSEDVGMSDDRSAVRNALQTGYGDAAQTVLDDRVAGSVLGALRERGWMSIEEVGALVLAAGGEIRVPPDALWRAGDIEVSVQDDFTTCGKIIRARRVKEGT